MPPLVWSPIKMATFRKRGNYWHVQIRKRGYPSQTKSFEKRSDGEKWAAIVEAKMSENTFVVQETTVPNLSEALTKYLKEVSVNKKSHRTELIYAKTLLEYFGARPLNEIKGPHVAEFKNHRLGQVSSSMVLKELAILSHLYNTAIQEWGLYFIVNPVTQIKKPKPGRARDRRVSKEELDYIISASKSTNLREIMNFAVETAARRGEIANLKWTDINFETRTAMLRETKNGEDRKIALSPRAIHILSKIPRSDVNVWYMHPDAITKAFGRALKRARKLYEQDCKMQNKPVDDHFLKNVHFHDLRHEATSQLFENGLTSEEARAITGHKTLQMLSRYTHLKAENIAMKLAETRPFAEEPKTIDETETVQAQNDNNKYTETCRKLRLINHVNKKENTNTVNEDYKKTKIIKDIEKDTEQETDKKDKKNKTNGIIRRFHI